MCLNIETQIEFLLGVFSPISLYLRVQKWGFSRGKSPFLNVK